MSALLARYLAGHGFRTSIAGSGAELDLALGNGPVDLILLDLGLPDEDGLIVLRRLQTHGIPVIVVTGRGEPVERVVGLELGADDYVTKPFDFRELLARMRSVLRRVQPEERPASPSLRAVAFDGMQLDTSTRRLTDRQGCATALTTGEFALLCTLLDHPNQTLSRDQLMNCLHGRDVGPFDRSIDVQIGRLRRKVERDPAYPQLIQSVRGVGYVFAAAVRQK
ncbi:winged helix-turn-helix domain-containing protein [Lysobacter sp. S4-A87]|nr:winged helix-turn-helix domain-containing protein [Lysobacter sp. S4-A87]